MKKGISDESMQVAGDSMILLISPLPPPAGGDSTWTVRYLKYCKRQAIPVCHVNTAVVGERAKGVQGASSLISEFIRAWRIWSSVRNEMQKRKVEVVHFNTNCSPKGLIRDSITLRLIKCYNVPIIVHCRCNVPDQIGKSRIGKYSFYQMIKMATQFIALNDISLRYIENLGAKAIIVPNFIDPDEITEKKQIAEKVSKAIFVGHVIPTKGINELIAAASLTPHVTFRVIGPISSEFMGVALPDNIEFLGAVNHIEVRRLLDDSDVFVFPSYTEGFSNALMEAMARGMPIIATDVGAASDMLEDMGGLLIETHNAKPIVESLHQLSLKETRETMSEWNLQKVKEHYSIDAVMKKLLSLYSNFVDGSFKHYFSI